MTLYDRFVLCEVEESNRNSQHREIGTMFGQKWNLLTCIHTFHVFLTVIG